MVTDRQARKVVELMQTEKTQVMAALKADMDVKTARKWATIGKLPSEVKAAHTWRTRDDPFDGVWEQVKPMLELEPGLEAKTIFERGTGQGDFLPAALHARRVVCVGLHVHERSRDHDRRCILRSLALSFCASLFQLGDRHDLLLRKF